MKNHILEKINQAREKDPGYFYYHCKKCQRDFWRGTYDQYGHEEIEFPNNLPINDKWASCNLPISNKWAGCAVYNEGLIYVIQGGKPTYILECTLSDEDYLIKELIK